MEPVHIGVAGWSIPRFAAEAFPAEGSVLERYAARLNCVEINSTFYRSHKRAVFERWAAATPDNFRFSVKAPKTITHDLRLVGCEALLATFASDIGALGDKLGPVLFQLPPSLAFDAPTALRCFDGWRAISATRTVCEPRHRSWFEPEADALLDRLRIARVAADPARVPAAGTPGGWQGMAYWRWHGSPQMYKSSYCDDVLAQLAGEIGATVRPNWVVFDNTMFGAATLNALQLVARLQG